MTNSSKDPSDWLDIRPARLDDVIPADPETPRADQDAPRWRRSLVATAHDHVVGVGWIALDQVTDPYVVEILVSPGHRRRGIGTRLFAALSERADQPFPVCSRVMTSQPWRGAFAEALGCQPIVQCPAPWIDPMSSAAQDWTGRRARPSGHRIQPIAEVDAAQVMNAWASYFQWSHLRLGSCTPSTCLTGGITTSTPSTPTHP